jgi:hypothetical protein
MIAAFSKYSIQKVEQEFVLSEGEALPQVAIVSFFGHNDEIISTLELGLLDPGYLYKKMANDQMVNLDRCYVENFSIDTLRKNLKLKQHQLLDLNSFKITNSVFHNEGDIDFTYVRFTSDELDFSSSIFLHAGIKFNHSELGDANIKFDNALFYGGYVNFTNAIFNEGLLSFKNSAFINPGDITTSKSNPKIKPKKRTEGILNFEFASFGQGTIDFTRSNFGSGDINFSNAILNKRNLLFVGAEFNVSRLTFKSMDFRNGNLDFRYANFNRGSLFFDRAIFRSGVVNFSATEFKLGKISFNRTEFKKIELIFESCELEKGIITFKNNLYGEGAMDFRSVKCPSSELSFENVDFGKFTATFFRSRVKELSLRSCQLNAYFNLQLKHCGSLDLSNTVVRDIVDMKPFGFKTNIDKLNLAGLLLLGHFYIDWHANGLKELIHQQDTTQRNKSEQFRILKENFHSLGQYDPEDEAYVEFRRSEAKADLEPVIAKGNILEQLKGYISYGFKWLIFDKIGLYATSPLRVLFSMAITYLFFVLIYVIVPFFGNSKIVPSAENREPMSQLGIAFYHSVVTFFTIGYGDFYPTGIMRWISGFEGFMGLFLISYFTVAFVRKVLR